MWPRKYGWLQFAILECSLNVWIVNKIVFAAPELCENALPNPKFLLHCRKWRNINLSWRKFQTSISSTLRNFFLVKTYKRDQWNLPNILAYISGIFDGFFKAGLVPLIGEHQSERWCNVSTLGNCVAPEAIAHPSCMQHTLFGISDCGKVWLHYLHAATTDRL